MRGPGPGWTFRSRTAREAGLSPRLDGAGTPASRTACRAVADADLPAPRCPSHACRLRWCGWWQATRRRRTGGRRLAGRRSRSVWRPQRGAKAHPAGQRGRAWAGAGDGTERPVGQGVEQRRRVRVAAGAPKTGRRVRCSTMRPAYITATVSATRSAAARSWVMSRRRARRRTLRAAGRMVRSTSGRSSPVVGSSASSSGGSRRQREWR